MEYTQDLTLPVDLEWVPAQQAPMALLLEADPSTASIEAYLDNAWCFAAKHKDEIVAVCVAKLIRGKVAEIFNMAVWPDYQRQGIGSVLLSFALTELAKKSVVRVELGTGSFGYQLTYYQRLGFRVEAVIKDHFLTHYDEPLFEQGLQHKDMLRLALEL
ncbi:GNAT family N-acetyltransferase [Shewanella mangrovisoli]|uniref:GNAT family N-acetyltransferase n=1 Tax=Shewanella mangrovisoli TaxID=2864211 RepID=A0ABV4VKM5_9GAMM